MYYVSVRLTDGLGNRLFQVAAMLGYAEKHGHTPLFVDEWIKPNTHGRADAVCAMFPSIARVASPPTGTWIKHTSLGNDCFTYKPLTKIDAHVLLIGFFQAPSYGPSKHMTPVLPTVSIPARCIFLHVRRGDYLLPICGHHRVELADYYRRALTLLDQNTLIYVSSDDIEWCKQALPVMYSGRISPSRWIFSEYVTDEEGLAAFASCDGGICANSTFSWWGAYLSRRSVVFMPDTWGYHPMPPVRDLYPSWATCLPVDKI